jgi:penicillin V acylase-like amidase (Ntn superfamily)
VFAARKARSAAWSGKSIVVEPVDGTLKVHDAPLGIMANAPTYDWHMTNFNSYINLSAKDVEGVKLGPGGRHGGRDHRMDERRRPQESALVLPNIRGSVDPHGRSQAGRAAANSEARTIEMEGTAQPISDTSTKFMAGK